MLADLLLSTRVWTALVILTGAYFFRLKRKSPFPVVNSYPGDILGCRARREVRENARTLITEGLAKHKGPVTIVLPQGQQKIVLPASLASWVKSNKDLDHKKLVKEDFFASVPGFEAQSMLHDADETPKRIIATKLGQNESTLSQMNASVARGLQALWGEDVRAWRTIDWHSDTMGLIARVASSIFVGPEKADDAEWLDLIQGYVLSYFAAVSELHGYPAWSRSLVHWFLPSAAACRKAVPQARAIMQEVVSKRQEEARRAEQEGKKAPEYNDVIAWAQPATGGNIDMGGLQLSLAMAAMFTTTEMFRQILIELACHPEFVEPLRSEVSRELSAHGVSLTALNNMVLLDSFMKESQRESAGLVVLERAALRDTVLPTGQTIPAGSHIMVDSTDLWDPAVYPSPSEFDGYRFFRKREEGNVSSQFVQSGQDFHVFGGGRHICPGRFFANNELKLTLAHILLKYDIQLGQGCDNPRPLQMGFYAMVNPRVQLEVKRVDKAAAGMLS
ncbi:hypothetical protein PG985_005732 [Apiospora marii]|uniref:uncharacterized protein n=1 Tax=Apiospora marii TaxID=335849 RepID=UPI00312DD77F